MNSYSGTGRLNGEFRRAQQIYLPPVTAEFQARNVREKSMIRPFDHKETAQ